MGVGEKREGVVTTLEHAWLMATAPECPCAAFCCGYSSTVGLACGARAVELSGGGSASVAPAAQRHEAAGEGGAPRRPVGASAGADAPLHNQRGRHLPGLPVGRQDPGDSGGPVLLGGGGLEACGLRHTRGAAVRW